MGYPIHQQLSIKRSQQTSNQQTFVCTRVKTLYRLLELRQCRVKFGPQRLMPSRKNCQSSRILSLNPSRRYNIIGGRKAILLITRNCVTCRRHLAKPNSQHMGQLPKEQVTPDAVFNNVVVDYAGPLHIKQGSTRKPVIIKAYVCVFASLSTRVVHLEAVTDLTSEAFIEGSSPGEGSQLYYGVIMAQTLLEPNTYSRSFMSS